MFKIGVKPALAIIICIVVIIVTTIIVLVSEALLRDILLDLAQEHAAAMQKLAASAVEKHFEKIIGDAKARQSSISRYNLRNSSDYDVVPPNITNASTWHSEWFRYCELQFLTGAPNNGGVVHTLDLLADGTLFRCKVFDGILINYGYSPNRPANDRRIEKHYYISNNSLVPDALRLPYAFPSDHNSSQFTLTTYPKRFLGSHVPGSVIFPGLYMVAFPSKPVLPLLTVLHDKNGNWLGTSVTATSIEEMDTLLKDAFRRNGIQEDIDVRSAVGSRVFMVLSSSSPRYAGGVVLASSDDTNVTTRECYNYSLRQQLWDELAVTRPLCIVSPVTDLAAACVVCSLGVNEYTAFPPLKTAVTAYEQHNVTSTRYKYDGEEYLTLATTLDFEWSGVDVHFTFAIDHYVFFPQSVVLHGVARIRLVSILSACGCAVLFSIIAVILTTWTLSPLTEIAAEMDRAANLQVIHRGDDHVQEKESMLSEVQLLQQSMQRMQEKLADVRSFVPHALFDAPNVESSEFLLAMESQHVNPLDIIDAENSTTGPPDTVPFALRAEAFRRSEFLERKASVMSLKVNTLQRKKGSKPLPYPSTAILQDIIQVFADEVEAARGIIDSMAFPNLLATFNAHQPCFQPARRAVESAIRISRQLRFIATAESSQPAFVFSIMVDTSTCSVGTVGTDERRATIVIGEAMKNSVYLHQAASCYYPMFPVLFTSRTRSEMYEFPCIPVDYLELPESCTGTACTLLTPSAGIISHDQAAIAEKYTSIFSYLHSDPKEAKKELLGLYRSTDNETIKERCDTIVQNIDAAFMQKRLTVVRAARSPWEPLGHTGPIEGSGTSWSFSQHVPPTSSTSTETLSEGPTSERRLLDENLPKQTAVVEDTPSVVPMLVIPHADEVVKSANVVHTSAHPPRVFADTEGREWRRGDEISHGSSSVVYRAMSIEGNIAVMKVLPLSECSNVDELAAELEVSQTLLHPNIVCFFASAVLESYFVLLMEYVSGGTLTEFLRAFAPLHLSAVKKFTGEMLAGLVYMHERGFAHADVKPSNVLMGYEQVCKLSGFGIALNHPRACDDVDDVRGTVQYMAPEVARGDSPSPRSDVFALGLIFVEMLTGKHPWHEHFMQQTAVKEADFVRRLAKEPDLVPNFSDGAFAAKFGQAAKDFAEGCLQFDPRDRKESIALSRHALLM